MQWAFVSGSGSSVSGEVGLDQSQGPKELEAISRLIDCSKEPYLAKGRSYLYSPDREDRAIAVAAMVLKSLPPKPRRQGDVSYPILYPKRDGRVPAQARVKVQRIRDRTISRAKGFLIFN